MLLCMDEHVFLDFASLYPHKMFLHPPQIKKTNNFIFNINCTLYKDCNYNIFCTKFENYYEFYEVINYDYNLICSICCDIYKNPYYFKPCLHTFCRKCIDENSIFSNNCALCRGTYLTISPNNAINNLINDTLVKCKLCNNVHKMKYKHCKLYECNKCKQIIKKQLIKQHLIDCGVIELCKTCNQIIISSLILNHSIMCKIEDKLETCSICKIKFLSTDLFKHMLKCKDRNKKLK